MSNSITSWFFEPPIDFESKKYRLLDNAQQAERMIEAGKIHEAMSFIEDHLVCFYKFKTEKELINYDNREIVGIDPFLMNLIFESPQEAEKTNKDIDILSDIAEMGVLEFEALHSIFRIKWRDIDDALKISYMPEKTTFISSGFVFLSNSDENWTRMYTFQDPSDCDDWTKFKCQFNSSHDYDPSRILDFIRTLKENESNSIVMNCVINKNFSNINAVDYVLACKIYYKLLKDYMF